MFGKGSFVGVPTYTTKVTLQSTSPSLSSHTDLPVLKAIEGSPDTFSNCQFFILKRFTSFSFFH